jgi:hypothetical protein
MFIVEIENHEVYIFKIIFILSGALISHVGFLAWETLSFYINRPNKFQSIWGLHLLLRSWFPTNGISLLSRKLRSGSRLISFHCSHMVHKLTMLLNKLSIHFSESGEQSDQEHCCWTPSSLILSCYEGTKKVLFLNQGDSLQCQY